MALDGSAYFVILLNGLAKGIYIVFVLRLPQTFP